MQFAALVPELLVSDLSASLRFWCDVVGFTVCYDRPEAQFAYLALGNAQLMLEQRSPTGDDWILGPLEAPYGRGLNLQIQVPALDAVLARCLDGGIALFLPPEERWYRCGTEEVGQRQCIVADPDGYLVRCIQPLGLRPAQPTAT